jgi:DNA invertase Pin-like site-specific DNA recombinase
MVNSARPALSAVQSAPRRVIAIIRVSDEGGRGEQLLSPDLQLASIERDAPRRGWKIVDVVEAVDQSGSQRHSAWWPTLDRQIERVESGAVDGIVAWKYSRFARSRIRWAIAVDRIESAGGILESATEELDATTSAGRFQRGVLAEVNAFQAEQIGESWKETHANRLARGLPTSGRPRFGYTYARETGFTPDPITGPVLAETYRRYVAGEGFHLLVRWLASTGTRPVDYGHGSKGEWSVTTLRRVLDSGFGAGLLNKHDPECRRKHASTGKCRNRIFLPGAHEPVIDEATWRKYRSARAERGRPQAARSERSPYLLTGQIYCMFDIDGEPCNGHMSYRADGPKGPMVFCQDATARLKHRSVAARAHFIEADVMAEMQALAADVEAAVARAAAAQADRSQELAMLDGQVAAALADLDRQTRRFMSDLIPEELWPDMKTELEATLANLRRKRDRLQSIDRDVPEVIAAEALEDWDTWPIEHQRAVLRRLFDRVEVTPGRITPVEGAKYGARRAGVRVVRRQA